MNATPGDGRYNYGYSFTDNYTNPSTGQPFSQQYGTVMSYNGLTLPYYSNPNATWYNENQAPYALGVAINLPLAADNALVMTNAAPAMAATHLGGIPAITQQPQSATVQMGGSFTLSTAATGNSLKYQWFKNSTAISGATGSSYGITGAATGDAGSYTVTVSNLAGSATSSAATVTVNSGSGGGGGGSSGGGGGGGGAPSEWFFGALGLLALARRAMRKR
jgi:hypothetical protein